MAPAIKTHHSPRSAGARHSRRRVRMTWELAVFVSLAALLFGVKHWLKVEFPDQYFDVAEKSCLAVEIASFFGIGD